MDWMDWVHLVTLHQHDGLPLAGTSTRMVLLASIMATLTMGYVLIRNSKIFFIFSVVFSLAFISYVVSVSKVHESYKYGYEYISRYGTVEQKTSMNRCLTAAKRGEIELPESFSTLLSNCEENEENKENEEKEQGSMKNLYLEWFIVGSMVLGLLGLLFLTVTRLSRWLETASDVLENTKLLDAEDKKKVVWDIGKIVLSFVLIKELIKVILKI